jgi:hypothetical protein
MAAPSKSWVVIADADVDADSPVDNTLVEGMRDDLVHLEEWLGHSYTAAQDHDHDGVNSAPIAAVIPTWCFRMNDGNAFSANHSGAGNWVTVVSGRAYFGTGFDTVRMAVRYYTNHSSANADIRLVMDGSNYAFDTGLSVTSYTWLESAITADISGMAGRPKWAQLDFQFEDSVGQFYVSGLNVTVTA